MSNKKMVNLDTEYLKAFLSKNGYKLTDVADMLKIAKGTFYHYTQRGIIKKELAERICYLFDADYDSLTYGTPAEEPEDVTIVSMDELDRMFDAPEEDVVVDNTACDSAIDTVKIIAAESVVTQPDSCYNDDCIDEMLLVFGEGAVMNYCLLNVWRYRKKAMFENGVEDIKISDWYMDKYKELNDELAKKLEERIA